MSARRARPRAFTSRERLLVVGLGVLVSVACSFSTDGITFIPDDEFDALAGSPSHAGSGGKAAAGANSGGARPEAGSGSGGEAGEAGPGGAAGVVDAGGTAGLALGGSAGHGGSGKGGALNTAGSNVGGTVGTAGRVNSAGAPSAGAPSAGAPSAGSGGQGPSGTVYPCIGDKPSDKLITDFKGITALGQEWKGGQMGATRFSVYGFPDPANARPNVKLGSENLIVEAYGVLMPTGAGIRISPCINLKDAQSIIFTMSGGTKSGDTPMIALRIYTNQNLLANDMTREGMCVPPLGQDPVLFCQPSHVDFALPAMPTQLEFRFADFRGGKPSEQLQLDQVKMIEWAFTSAGPVPKAYDGSYTVDDVGLSY